MNTKEFDLMVDEITDEVIVCMQRIYQEFEGHKLDSTKDPAVGVCYIAFHLGREYFLAARDTIKQGRVIGSGTLIRAAFENLADIFYIFKTPERTHKYAQKYVHSLEMYRQVMSGLHGQDIDTVFNERKTKQVNKWSGNATIDDRLSDLSKSLTTVYDMFSYFSHPNPAAIIYLGIPGLRAGQLGLSRHINCHVAIVLMVMCVEYGGVVSVTDAELQGLVERLGVPAIRT